MTSFFINLIMPLIVYVSNIINPLLETEYGIFIVNNIKPTLINILYKFGYHFTIFKEYIIKNIPESGFKIETLYLPNINIIITNQQCVNIFLNNNNLENQLRIIKFNFNSIVSRLILKPGIKYQQPIIYNKHMILSANKNEIDYTNIINEYLRCTIDDIDFTELVDDKGIKLLDKNNIIIINQCGEEVILNIDTPILKKMDFIL